MGDTITLPREQVVADLAKLGITHTLASEFKAAPATAAAPSAATITTDGETGKVRAIVSVTGVMDEVADIIIPGAFRDTLLKRKPKVCWHHAWEKPVGRTTHIEEWMPGDPRLPAQTKDGKPWPKEAGALVATAQFNLKSERGKEAFEAVRFFSETNECEWSIGYKVRPGQSAKDKAGRRHIKALDLFEYSFVLFGAAPLSMTLDLKELADAWQLEVKGSAGTFLLETKGAGTQPEPATDPASTDADEDGAGWGDGGEDDALTPVEMDPLGDEPDGDPSEYDGPDVAVADEDGVKALHDLALPGLDLTLLDTVPVPFVVVVDSDGLSQQKNLAPEVGHVITLSDRLWAIKGGQALPDGSWPIVTEDDLSHALAYAEAKGVTDPTIREHLWRSAGRLERLDLVGLEGKDYSAAERRAKPTLPGDGDRFPIGNVDDLVNAVQNYGRAKDVDKAKVKQWIIRRARALDAVSKLPESWGVKADDVDLEGKGSTPEDLVQEKAEDLDASVALAAVLPDDYDGHTEAKAGDGHTPPQGVRDAAKRALDLMGDGKAGSGFTGTGRARASQLAAGKSVSDATVRRMKAYFDRHQGDRKPDWGKAGSETPGYVAWQAWGGDAGYTWAKSVVSSLDGESKAAPTGITDVCPGCHDEVEFDLLDGWQRKDGSLSHDDGSTHSDHLAPPEPALLEGKAGGADRNRGGAENLRKWYVHGPGAAEIGWGTSGDWERCVKIAGKHLGERAKGYCALRHKEATGEWPGKNAHGGKAKAVAGKKDDGSDVEVKKAQAVPEDGLMVALRVPPALAKTLAVQDGNSADELHLSVVIGDDSDTYDDGEVAGIAHVLTAFARFCPPLIGSVGGIGMFPSSGDGVVSWVPVDVPALIAVRQRLLDVLDDTCMHVKGDHGFTPHITLGYDIGTVQPVPSTPVTFDTLVLGYGGKEWTFPLGGAFTAGYDPDLDGDDDAVEPSEAGEKALAPMGSFEAMRSILDGAIRQRLVGEDNHNGERPDGMVSGSRTYAFIEATFPDRVIATVIGPDDKTTSYELAYAVTMDGEVTLGDPSPVTLVTGVVGGTIGQVADDDDAGEDPDDDGDDDEDGLDLDGDTAEDALDRYLSDRLGDLHDVVMGLQESKAGRVLSGANVTRLRGAVQNLLTVLAAAGVDNIVEPAKADVETEQTLDDSQTAGWQVAPESTSVGADRPVPAQSGKKSAQGDVVSVDPVEHKALMARLLDGIPQR